jgi:hypothetical protein
MTPYDFVQLTLLALDGEVKGKTKLQKIVYFLGLMTGHEGKLGYRPHYYGPYSAEVDGAIGRLKALGFLDQTISGGGAYDAQGFEVARHDYRLSEAGRRVAKAKAAQVGENWRLFRDARERLAKLLDLDYMRLSIAAKLWFMLGERRGSASTADLEALAPRFGWSVSREQLREAAAHLAEVGLVTSAPDASSLPSAE